VICESRFVPTPYTFKLDVGRSDSAGTPYRGRRALCVCARRHTPRLLQQSSDGGGPRRPGNVY